MSELWQPGALELAGRIRRGEVTSRAVVEAHLARADAVKPDQIEHAVGCIAPTDPVLP